ncbi:MAG: hypothetical protein B6D39_02365 [Anaerolineae bacterium UTCFX2]|jgi:peptidoglycan/LPS O-acetylase OafA/YrhL|nr:acyltransferase [Anaerolineales bacterium]OQY93925.1 MAG: hypothetical protein B6D39_02365 [Anaerolineae bacterium UTCFX2]
MVKKLLYLNGLAVLAVVLNHSLSWSYISLFWWTDRYLPVSVPNFDQLGSPIYYLFRFLEQLIIFAIPAFLFVSGFFLAFAAGRGQSPLRWNIIFVRLKNLLIPFFIWSVIILLMDIALGREVSPAEFLLVIVTGRAADPFYFIPVLAQLYLISPFIVRFARNNWKMLLLVTGAVHAFFVLLRYPPLLNLDIPFLEPIIANNRHFLFPSYIFFLTLGMVFGFHSSEFKEWLYSRRWLLLGLTGAFFLLGVIEWEMILKASGQEWLGPSETLIDQIYAGFFLLTFFAFERTELPLPRTFNFIGAKSYGVYLTHTIVLIITAKAVYHLIPQLLGLPLLFLLMLTAAGVALPLLLMEIVNRSPLRRYYALIFG